MSYRSDLEAAQNRAEASQREVERLEKQLAARAMPLEPEALEMPIPERFRVARSDDDVRVSWRWFSPGQHLLGLIFAIVWTGVSVLAVGQAGSFVGPLAFVAVGLGLSYSTLTGFVNRTTVRASCDGTLSVTHGPLPWRGNVTLDRAAIKQVYVNRDDSDSEKSSTYDVCALLTNGREKKLVKSLKQRLEARYIEHAVEQVLGIADAVVPGEAARS